MAQILRFPKQNSHPCRAENLSRLINSVSSLRRQRGDVYWLKENAELLSVLESTGTLEKEMAEIDPKALTLLQGFYQEAERHLCFFRQYYRFVLSICMDLEDLGLATAEFDLGKMQAAAAPLGEGMAHWVMQQSLPQQELSDLQRAEARYLLARRGVHCDFPGLDERLHSFMDDSSQFSVPNRKTAYELTHVVFYLSGYGRSNPKLSAAAIQSLKHVGLVAFLDRDADLLSEVCVSLRYCEEVPDVTWETWLTRSHQGFQLVDGDRDGTPLLYHDDYHMFLVSSWHQALYRGAGLHEVIPKGALRVHRVAERGILSNLSNAVFEAGEVQGSWQRLRPRITERLSAEEYAILCAAERSCDDFEVFFDGFARMGTSRTPSIRAMSG